MINRFWGIIKFLFLKIKYRTKIKLGKNILKSYCSEIRNINIDNGNINIEKRVYMRRGSLFSANNGGIIKIKSCFMNQNAICTARGEIIIGENVTIGPNVMIYDHDHYFDENGITQGKYKIGKISIGNNVWIGAGTIILRDTVIGDNCVIGAGAIVKGVIPNNSLVKSDRKLIIEKLIKK